MVPVFVKSGGAGALGVGHGDTGSPIGDSDVPSHSQCPVKAFLWDCAREGGGRYAGWGFAEPGLSPCAAPDLD